MSRQPNYEMAKESIALRNSGKSQDSVAETLGIGLRTVQWYDSLEFQEKFRSQLGLGETTLPHQIPWEDWLQNHLGDAQRVIDQYVAHRRTEAMYVGRVPEALKRWRTSPYAEKVLAGIRDRENRLAALELKFAEAISTENNRDALALTDDLESMLREWISV